MLKPVFDVVATTIGLILLSPLLLLIAILVRIKHGSPVLFCQTRAGLHGKPFRLLKFRTMTNARSSDGHLLPDEQRLTRLGKFLRGTSVDELPGLINVLKGEMSLVGPRPLLMQYMERYTPHQARRHGVKPGITGWAQVNGRNAVGWEEKFRLDVWYVDHCNLLLDLKILLITSWRVLRRDGVCADGHATCPEFQGETRRNATQPRLIKGEVT